MDPKNPPTPETRPFDEVDLEERLDEFLPFPEAPDLEERLAEILTPTPLPPAAPTS
jgi:hypothetical protein